MFKREPTAIPAGSAAPAPSLWRDWSSPRILGLAILLIGANFGCQVLVFSLDGGLFAPVLGGALLGVVAPTFWILRRGGFSARRDLSLRRPSAGTLALGLALALAALAPTSLLAEFSLRLHPADPRWAEFLTRNLPRTPQGMALAAAAAVIAAPLAEEIVFRGLIHRLAARTWGAGPGLAISSLAFGIVHGEPWFLFGLCGVGLALGFLLEATGSLVVCWAAHALHNAVSLAMMYRRGADLAAPSDLTAQDWALAGGSAAAAILLGRILWARRRRGLPHAAGGAEGGADGGAT